MLITGDYKQPITMNMVYLLSKLKVIRSLFVFGVDVGGGFLPTRYSGPTVAGWLALEKLLS